MTVANVQAKEDGDKPGLEAMLQKVLQLYASRVLSKRSYAKKGIFVFTSLTYFKFLYSTFHTLNMGYVTNLYQSLIILRILLTSLFQVSLLYFRTLNMGYITNLYQSLIIFRVLLPSAIYR